MAHSNYLPYTSVHTEYMRLIDEATCASCSTAQRCSKDAQTFIDRPLVCKLFTPQHIVIYKSWLLCDW